MASKGGLLKGLLGNKKYIRNLKILAVALVIFWVFRMFFLSSDDGSRHAQGVQTVSRDLSASTGSGSVVTDSKEDAQRSRDFGQRRAKEAEEKGESSLTLTRSMNERNRATAVPATKEQKPAVRHRSLPTPQVIREAPVQQRKERDEALEAAVAQAIGMAVSPNYGTPGRIDMDGGFIQIVEKEKERQEKEKAERQAAAAAEAQRAKESGGKEGKSAENLPDIGIPAGEMLYAVTMTACNSDQPETPVLAQVLSGRWRGAKVIGDFKRQDERLVIQFSKVVFKGREFAVKAYAIDPKTAQAGLESDVDTHFLARWGGLIASTFLQGFGQAISQSGAETQSTAYGTTTWMPKLNTEEQVWAALGKVGEKAGQQFEKNFDRPPTVRLDKGTEIGILIL